LGERIEVNSGGKGKWFGGEISKVYKPSDGQKLSFYDIDCDDFVCLRLVSSDLIRLPNESDDILNLSREVDAMEVDDCRPSNTTIKIENVKTEKIDCPAVNTSSKTSKQNDVIHIIDDEDEDEVEREIQKGLRFIEESERKSKLDWKTVMNPVSSSNSKSNNSSVTSSYTPSSYSSSLFSIKSDPSSSIASRPAATKGTSFEPQSSTRNKPLYSEGMRVQISRNNLWCVGRILTGGVRSDGTYDVEFDPVDGREGSLGRRVAEMSIREYVPKSEGSDSDDDLLLLTR
jgi:hypothetical protein